MRADRLLSILLRLQERKKVTAKELATELEVSPRTIYRDIDALGMAGIPIYTQRGEDGGCFLDEAYRISLNSLKIPELQALFVRGGEVPLEALNINRAVEDGLLKLLTSLPTAYQQQAKALQQRLYIDTKRWNQTDDNLPYLEIIQDAVWGNNVIDVIYQSHDKPATSRQLDPYGLVVKTHIWYLLARPIELDDFHIYRVSRFQAVSITKATFVRDETFNLQAIWHQKRETFETLMMADYHVRLRIPHDLLRALDYFIPNRYVIIDDSNKQSVVEAQFYNINEARHIIMGFGNQVDVLEPQTLIDSILDIAKSIVAQHE